MEDESLPGAPTPPSDSALVAMPPTPPGVITVSKPTGGDAAAEVDPETRAAVADLIATNRKLRRAVKERDAERSTLRAETEKLKKELSEATVSQQQHSEDLVSLRQELEATKRNQVTLRRTSSSAERAEGSSGGGGGGAGGAGGKDRLSDGGPAYQNFSSAKGKRKILHPLNPELHMVDPSEGSIRRAQMTRQTSIATSDVLDGLDVFRTDALAQKFVDVYKDPTGNIAYMASAQFAEDILKLCAKAKDVFEAESRVLYLESPAYVFGDTHGNLEDLHFFSDNLWRLGMNLCAGKFLFLGDYVDRGMSSLEVVTYLIALKTLYPDKVFMLRGNHETRDVNGWEEHYGDRSFIAQCKNRFGPVTGEEVWEELNCVFDRLPLAAVIDRDIFCIHGGVPRPLPNSPPGASRLEMLQKIPAVSGINPPYDHEDEHLRQMASECIWSDPAGEDQEESGELGDDGFGESPRGGGTICFGNKSLDDFLLQHGLSYVMRAHEAHSHGVSLSKKARCFTVFSTSKDHNQGSAAICGCILVDYNRMEVITRSPAYKNQYVHRRDSMSVQALGSAEFEARERVGLITEAEEDSDYEDDEEYGEYDEEDEEGAEDGGEGSGGEGASGADEDMAGVSRP